MPETVTIDGRGMTVRDAINEMWDRMRPLELRGFHAIAGVEIVDTSRNQVIETFLLTDPEFLAHLEPDQDTRAPERLDERPHAPERKESYPFVARITLEA